MKKTLCILAIAATATAAQAQLLWKVSGNGLGAPSYVFGTYHLAPLSVLDSVPAISDAVSSTAQVYGEVSVADMASSMQAVAAAMALPDGTDIASLLDRPHYEKADSMARELLGVGLDNPAMRRLKPAAISTQLEVAIYSRLTPGFDPMEQIDVHFMTAAIEAGKPVKGLETVAEQIGVLFGATLERQAQLLACLADNADLSAAQALAVTRAYMSQDLDALAEAMEMTTGGGCDPTPEEKAALVDGRNAAWAEKMPSIMAEAPTLFVVGAGHLPGERGLLALLAARGYTVVGLK